MKIIVKGELSKGPFGKMSSIRPMALLLWTVFLLFSTWCSADDVSYTLCTGNLAGVGEVTAVKVDPCPPLSNGGCVLEKNTEVNIEIHFKPNNDSTTLKHRVYGMVWGIAVPYVQAGGLEACNKVEPTCPLTAGSSYIYTGKFNVLSTYPKLDLNVRWHLITDDNKLEVCVLIPVKIDDKTTK